VNNNGLLRGVLGLESLVSDKEQGTLNPIGVNCIRLLDQPTGGKAIFVFGGRTLSSDANFKYVSVRRTLTYVEESVRLSSRFAVFQKNSPALWSLLTQIITQFLRQEWEDGNLAGATQEQAFFVEINQNTMTATDIENGILRGRIGVSLHRPAEFIIFTFSQTQSGSEIEEG
jgi:hypothetical protein